jgi:hypothetical protein
MWAQDPAFAKTLEMRTKECYVIQYLNKGRTIEVGDALFLGDKSMSRRGKFNFLQI